MRFKQFILEDAKFNVDKFLKDCAYFIEQTHTGHGDLWVLKHGTKSEPSDFEIRKFKERNAPRNSPMILHDSVNDFYKKKFGFPFRNGMFTTGAWTQASMYGPVCAVIPIGKFEWLCSWDVDDLLSSFDTKMNKLKRKDPTLDYDERQKATVDNVIQDLEKDKFMHNTNLNDCIRSHNEIMIKCDSFYIFNMDSDSYEIMREALQQANK